MLAQPLEDVRIKHSVENQPGYGSFCLTVTEGTKGKENTITQTVPVIDLIKPSGEERAEIIFDYIQQQRRLGTPVIAWREGSDGLCSFWVNSEVLVVEEFSLTEATKKRENNPYASYLGISSTTTQRKTISLKPSEYSNFHFLNPINPQIGRSYFEAAKITGQTPAGLPLKATISFQPSQP